MRKRIVKVTVSVVITLAVLAALYFVFEIFIVPHNLPEDYTASANSYVGICGENIKWSLNTVEGKLELEGKGDFPNYESAEDVPWYTYSKYIKEVSVENGITDIGPNLFYKAKKLTHISIPRSVKSIGAYAFYGCVSLYTVDFSENSNLLKIDESAFAYCRSLTDFDLPTRVNTIGKNAFLCCYSLEDMTLGYSVTSIGEGAFSSCCNLKKLKIVNYECDIFDDGETVYRNIKIECFENSTAKDYADKYLRTYSQIKDMKNIKDMKVKLEYDECVYDGKKKKPKVTVKGLKQGEDFTVNYTKNTNPGVASVTVSAAGTTLGEVTLNFTIKPQKPKRLRLRNADTKSLTLTWNSVYGATGYDLYMLTGGKWKKVATVSENKATVNKLSKATEYKFKVRAYVKTDSEKIKSKFSSEITCSTSPDKTKITSVVNRGVGRLTVSWERVSNADGYVVYVSTKKNGTYKEAAVVNGSSRTRCVLTKLESNKKLYVTVKAFVKVGNDKVLSAESNKISKSPM